MLRFSSVLYVFMFWVVCAKFGSVPPYEHQLRGILSSCEEENVKCHRRGH